MRESLARFGTAGTALIFGSVAVWLLLLIVVPHLMLIDYAFHANPGAIDKGLAAEGWTLYSFRPLFDPSDALAFNTFVRTVLTSAVITDAAFLPKVPGSAASPLTTALSSGVVKIVSSAAPTSGGTTER